MRSADILQMAQHGLAFASHFSASLLAPDLATPSLVIGPHGKGADKRYNVYRNNVTVSLIDALAATFPAVQRITGTDFFRAMARFHVRETPPSSPLLFEYGRDFANFIDRYEYAQSMPWLGDIARLERAWLDAYHAADCQVLAAEKLASVSPAHLAELRFKVHPATRVLRSRYPAVTVFAANRNPGPVGRVDNVPEDALITRPESDVVVRLLQPGGAAFLRYLLDGQTLGAAVAAAFESNPSFDLPAMISEMIAAGAFSDYEMENFDDENV